MGDVEAEKPNSAIRNCARVEIIKNGEKITALVVRDRRKGWLSHIDKTGEALIAGFGRKRHADGDLPGGEFKVVKVSAFSVDELFEANEEKEENEDKPENEI